VLLQLDLKRKVIRAIEHGGFIVGQRDRLVADATGRTHLLFRDMNVPQKDSEAVIAYRTFGPAGELEGKTEIARTPIPWQAVPALGITPDPDGKVHIYYSRPIKVDPANRSAGDYKVVHLERKFAKPAIGPRCAVVLPVSYCGTSIVDAAGKQRKLPSSTLEIRARKSRRDGLGVDL
jgi:hypothetical protein